MSDVAILILAAGQASRFRAQDQTVASKVVAMLDGKPLVRHAADAALASRARPVVVVTGHARDEVERALAGLDAICVHNAQFAAGMAGSLQAGLAALPAQTRGVVVMLADMPRIGAAFLDALIDAFEAAPDAAACVPVHRGQRGNPVLLSKSLFEAAGKLAGDEGARRMLQDPALKIVEVEGGEDIALDIDTPAALARAAGDKS